MISFHGASEISASDVDGRCLAVDASKNEIRKTEGLNLSVSLFAVAGQASRRFIAIRRSRFTGRVAQIALFYPGYRDETCGWINPSASIALSSRRTG
jgi:hypothetical protein